jgi:hypothetical protein
MRAYLLAAALALAPATGVLAQVTVEKDVDVWVSEQQAPSVTIDRDVTIGDPLPDTVKFVEVPKYKQYGFAVVNNRRVIVDPGTRKVIKVYD